VDAQGGLPLFLLSSPSSEKRRGEEKWRGAHSTSERVEEGKVGRKGEKVAVKAVKKANKGGISEESREARSKGECLEMHS